ncbi:MAG: redoxin domain-containing protein [Bacteroidetes bacterium]|jgi:thiol-disulfide isomerase/thioredoxin|nr:redoxin domain-containing protein [Bacteroidota bacterium]
MKNFGFIVFVAFLMIANGISAQLDLKVEVAEFEKDTLFLGYYYANKQYFLDTAIRNDETFRFSSEENVPHGLYLLYNPENQKYHDIILAEDQRLRVKTDTSFNIDAISFEDSPENEDFYDYIRFIGKMRPKAQALQEKLPDEKAQKELKKINERVRKRQNIIIEKYNNSISGLIVRNSQEIQFPDFQGTEEEVRNKKYQYFKNHFLDHIDVTDERLMRTPFFFNSIEQYITQIIRQNPDTIIAELDELLLPMHESNPEGFRFFLSHFLNKYAKSKIVGQDAIYVHLAKNYYGQGLADWVSEETLDKIIDEAQKKSGVLIGNAAPNISLLRLPSNEKLNLYDIESPYTILYFWDPDCGHCKKQTPDVISFYKDFKDKGIELVAICTKLNTDAEKKCLKYIEGKEGMNLLTNAYDPFLRSRYKQKYDIRTTPRIYILDENKEIVMKGIAAKKLPEVMNFLMEKNGK